MRYHPLPTEYINALNLRESYSLVIMGKDPYPTGAVGIPFCKSSWDSFCVEGVSGLYVFRSLGINVNEIRRSFCNPREFFIYLARNKGIVFLNLSYHFLDGVCRKKKHHSQLLSAEVINQKYLQASRNTVLCGEANKIRWYKNSYNNLHEAVHPDARCKISKHEDVRDDWYKWWSENALKERFEVRI